MPDPTPAEQEIARGVGMPCEFLYPCDLNNLGVNPRTGSHRFCEECVHVAAIARALADARERLGPYLRHAGACRHAGSPPMVNDDCSCGLAAAIRADEQSSSREGKA